MKIIALFALLAIANAASNALYYAELAHTDAGCSAATHVGGSATLVSASCAKGQDDFYYGVRCSDDNLSVSQIRCPATDATCTSNACTVVGNVPQCSAGPFITFLRKRCYATAADVPLVTSGNYVVTRTYPSAACSGATPLRIYNVPTGLCSPATPTNTQSTIVTCTASSFETRIYNGNSTCSALAQTVPIRACQPTPLNNVTTYTAVSCYGAGNSTLTTTSTSGSGGNSGGTTGTVNNAVYLSASAFVAFISLILIAAF